MQSRSSFLRSAGAASVAVVAVPLVGRAAGLQPVNVINTGSLDSFVMQNLVQDSGYFARYGVAGSPTNVSDGIKLLASIVQGGSDLAIMTGFNQIFPAIEAGAGLKLIAGVSMNFDYAVYCGNPSVRSLKDLAGKSVGVGAIGALSYVAMAAMLQKAGVDRDTVRFVNIGSSADAIKAVLARKIDAAPAQHDYLDDARSNGLHVIADAYELVPKYMAQAAFTSDRTLATKRETLVRTLAAYGRCFRFLNDNGHGAAFEAAYVKSGGTVEHAKTKWNWYRGHHVYAGDLQLPLDRLNEVQRINVSVGLQYQIMPLAKVADLSVARDALKLMK